MNSIHFYVVGDPCPQPRPKASARPIWKDGRQVWVARVHDPGTAEAWKSRIWATALKYKPAKPLIGPVCVDVTFYFPRPAGHFRTGKHAGELKDSAPTRHTSENRADRDNLDKALLDTLEKAGFFHNDGQVSDGQILKRWCPVGFLPGADVMICQIEESPGDSVATQDSNQEREPMLI